MIMKILQKICSYYKGTDGHTERRTGVRENCVVDAHAQSMMAAGVTMIPPREFDRPSQWHYRMQGARL